MSDEPKYPKSSRAGFSTGCVLLLTLVIVSAGRAGESHYRRYSDPTYQFSIDYPNSWRPEAGNLPDTKLRVTPGATGVVCFVKIMKSERFPNATSDRATATMYSESGKLEAMMQKMYADFQFLESSQTRINRVSYWKAVAQFSAPGGEKIRNVEIRTASRGNFYSVACTAPLAVFDTYKITFEDVIESFRLNPGN